MIWACSGVNLLSDRLPDSRQGHGLATEVGDPFTSHVRGRKSAHRLSATGVQPLSPSANRRSSGSADGRGAVERIDDLASTPPARAAAPAAPPGLQAGDLQPRSPAPIPDGWSLVHPAVPVISGTPISNSWPWRLSAESWSVQRVARGFAPIHRTTHLRLVGVAQPKLDARVRHIRK